MVAIVLTVFLVAVLWAAVLALHLPILLAAGATAGMVLAWAGALAWRAVGTRRAAGQIEGGLRAQAEAHARSASPDQRAEIEEMREEFAKAIQALKSSRLGQGGRNALAVLPWYMIIGPPGAGKSTALRASGLKFPYATKRGGVRGVGGTKNCEWWLTNQAVILDTAGRYATEEEDHDEWMTFLGSVARARPRKPINGLIVAVPLPDVAALNEEGAGELGQKMRERIDEVMARLQVVLPVYVLLTKCDLLPGFVESFADLRKNDRNQVWGFTLPLDAGEDRAGLFGEPYDELVGVIEARAARRLSDERQLAARERIYEFPQHLAAARPQLGAFLETLVAESVYQETPILRGLYLTSGTQEGQLVDRIMSAMADAFGVRPALAEAVPALEAKSYFLRDFFDKVVFPDRHLAFLGAAAKRRLRVADGALAGAAAVLLAAFLAFPLRAYLANRALVHQTRAEVEAVAARLVDVEAPSLPLLEPLRQRLDLLVRYQQEGPPWWMRFGMYRGGELLEHVRKLYAGAVRRLVLDPAYNREVKDLEAFVARLEQGDQAPPQEEQARRYRQLKLYLLVTAPRALGEPPLSDADAAWIGTQVAESWEASGATPEERPLYERHAALWARLLAGDPGLALPRFPPLVDRARKVLSRLPPAWLAEEQLAAQASGKGLDLTLTDVVNDPAVLALQAAGKIRGAYTKRGYEEVVKPLLDAPEKLGELWVVASGGRGQLEAERKRIRSRYFERYIEEWRRFLQGLAVTTDPRSVKDDRALLQELTRGEPPLYPRLFTAVARHTRLGGLLGGLEKKAGAAAAAAASATPVGAAVTAAAKLAPPEEPRFDEAAVEAAFEGFVRFGVPPTPEPGKAPARTPLDAYQEALNAMRDAIVTADASGDPGNRLPLEAAVKARTTLDGLLRGADGRWAPRLQALLDPPVRRVLGEQKKKPVQLVGQSWCDQVVRTYRQGLAGRYPFARNGPDAALPDVAAFLRPGTGALWDLYAKSLTGVVEPSGNGFRFQRAVENPGFLPALPSYLGRAQELTRALFPQGAQEPSVSFSVRIHATAPIATTILVIDGQRYECQTGPEKWHALVWPNKAAGGDRGASLRYHTVGQVEGTIERTGEWGLLRWIELGKVVGSPSDRDFTLAFDTGLGSPLLIDFHLDLGASPFFRPGRADPARLLEPFRTFPAAPSIAAGVGCD